MTRPDNRRTRLAALAACLATTFTLSMLQAQAFAQAAEGGASARAFEAAYFASFNPVTAEDMVRRIPGFTIDDGEVRRGFAGAAGNVLINGERPSSKTPISEQLSRISARDVLRVDLYSGGAEGAGASGQTLYVDVRLRPRDAGAAATNTFVVQASQLDPSGSINPLVVLTSAFEASGANVNLALQAQPARRGRIEYDKVLRTPGGAITEQGPEHLQGSYWEYKLSGRAAWKPSEADTFSLNAQVTPSKDGRHTFSEVHDASGALLRSEDSLVVGDNALAAELGGDWERRLSPASSFKLIGLASNRDTGSSERYSRNAVSGSFVDTLIERAAQSGEYIGRGVFSWKPDKSHALEFGGEAAFNFLDSELSITRVTPLGTMNVTPPVANTRVEEERTELYVADTWQVSNRLKLESRLTVESSAITQTGDAAQERDFTFWKPRFNATWDAGASGQFRLLLERDAAQLDFTEFATAVSTFDDNLSIGNPNLEPERTWRLQGEWEKRFGGKGALTLSLFHEKIEEVQDQIPVYLAGPPEQWLDSAGNLGDGTRTGARLNLTAPLDVLGLTGAELRVNGMVQETSVRDPLTGLDRSFSGQPDWEYAIDFRQPLPGLNLLWGALYEDAARTDTFRSAELTSLEWDGPHIDFFVETTAIQGLIIRFTVNDITLPKELRERYRFAPNRAGTANLASIEQRYAQGAYGTRSYAIRVSGRF